MHVMIISQFFVSILQAHDNIVHPCLLVLDRDVWFPLANQLSIEVMKNQHVAWNVPLTLPE